MNTEAFYSTYYYNDGIIHAGQAKTKDGFCNTIGLVPFTSNPSVSDFDGSVPLSGITGEFFRLVSGTDEQFEEYCEAEDKVRAFITQQKGMKDDVAARFCEVMKDLMNIDGKFNPIDSSFLRYAPCDTVFRNGKNVPSKYGDGQKKLAQYLYAMLDDYVDISLSKPSNLFSDTIQQALSMSEFPRIQKDSQKYYILPFVKRQFLDDLKWLLDQENSVIIGNIDMFLYFYCCYSVVQTIVRLDASNYHKMSDDTPVPFFFILDHEAASEKRDVVRQGWSRKLSDDYIRKLYGRMQAVDMLNTLVSVDGKPIGLYPELAQEFSRSPLDADVRAQCETILEYCKDGKLAVLTARKTSASKADDITKEHDLSVDSYDVFFQKLEKVCREFQSFEYHVKMVKRLLNLMRVRLLQTRRGRGKAVLVLDEEMLILMIALATRGTRCKLKDMYEKLKMYGICFDVATRKAVEENLLKLNLLERRSDSGDAQYVKIVL